MTDVNLWKLDFIHLINLINKKKGKFIINKGNYSLCYNFSPYVIFFSVTFKKNNIVHRDDDNPCVIVYFYNFTVKINLYYKNGKLYRDYKLPSVIEYNQVLEIIREEFINNNNYYLDEDKASLVIYDKKIIKRYNRNLVLL